MHHLLFQKLTHLFQFLLCRLNQQLIVHLQDESGSQAARPQLLVYANHRNFDDIGRRSLDRRIHRHPFPKGTLHKIRGFQFRHRAASAKHCRHISVFFRILHRAVQKFLDSRIGLKVLRNVLLRLFPCDAQVLA